MKKLFFLALLSFLFLPHIRAEAATNVVGEKRIFTITGYYSPLPNQEFFLTGSYESEIRLNGRGTNGADGTPVFPGMIAAPSTYPFGLKICVPGFGCGAVHDRGGAIVTQGERDLARHDRLDLWMGYGMEGLQRALSWGVQHVECEVFAADAPVEMTVNFSVPPALVQILDLPGRPKFPGNRSRGARGGAVEALQRALKKLGFYAGSIDGFYDYDTENAVFQFQKKHFLVTDPDGYGAGVFGPQTRDKLTEVLYHFEIQEKIYELWQQFHFEDQLVRGARNAAVLKLQQILVSEEFMAVAPTGFFGPITEKSLTKFQLDRGIIKSPHQLGAGQVGPETRTVLNELLAAKQEAISSEKKEVLAYQKSQQKLALLAHRTQKNAESFSLGDRGESVQNLQLALRELGYFLHSPNGFYGESTRDAVQQFQLDHGVIQWKGHGGAGIFGPSTRTKFLEVLRG
ncbi:MAG: peptidoglycan-binding protein [Candidatus Gracilibacteria bacterium]|nr:peptidoglycan-binding protein [Candidatus Gracilibacteria bacterium]